MNRIALLIAATVLAAGCATEVPRMKNETSYERYQPYIGSPIDHFTAFRFDGWEAVGRNQVVVWTSINVAYLLTVWDTCHDLNFAQNIGLTSSGHTVSKFENLHVGADTCPIQEIRPVDIRSYKKDRAALREKK